MCLNNFQEKHLIDLLRLMTYDARNVVIQVAIAMRQAHPWRDGLGALHDNTATRFPASDPRFFTPTND